VHWSESREFDEGTHYDFMDFEHKALEVAKINPRGGYDKTKVTVLFDNEDRYECCLDLGYGGNVARFSLHCLSVLAYCLRLQYDVDNSWLHYQHNLSLIETIQSYKFDMTFAESTRQEIQQVKINVKAGAKVRLE
jgi:hypothetical protein